MTTTRRREKGVPNDVQDNTAGGGPIARFWVLAAIGLSALLLVACGDDDEDTSGDGAAATGVAATTAAGSQAKIGGAAIASKPRDIAGLFTIDDGVAMFKERPASEDRTGITKDTIKIGRHFALTGPGAVGGPTTAAIEASIEKVNAAGGVHGRKIELTTRDDQFNPAVASQVVRELVERDEVFAMFNGLGTAQSAAVFDYLISKKVPNLFMQTGAVEFGEPTQALAYPGASAYILETRAMADFIYKEHPDAKLAIIYQNDGYGKNNLDGLRAGAKAHGKELVSTVSYDIGTPDLTSQIQQVVNSGATAVFLATYPNEGVKVIKGLRETAGSKMPIYLSVVSTSGNVADGAGQQNYDGAVGSISSLDVVDIDKPVIQASKKLADETKQPFLVSLPERRPLHGAPGPGTGARGARSHARGTHPGHGLWVRWQLDLLHVPRSPDHGPTGPLAMGGIPARPLECVREEVRTRGRAS